MALRHSEVFGNVLSQSGVFGAPLAGDRLAEPNSISRLFIAAPKLPISFYIEVGLYEGNNGDLPIDELALTESMVTGNRHFRDVLLAKGYEVTYRETGAAHNNLHFRSTLPDALMVLLAPAK
jgi:enterochelin esterase family protein